MFDLGDLLRLDRVREVCRGGLDAELRDWFTGHLCQISHPGPQPAYHRPRTQALLRCRSRALPGPTGRRRVDAPKAAAAECASTLRMVRPLVGATVSRGLLVTADGTEFGGVATGSPGMAAGEVVFNTAMAGYQEVITDPSYSGQIVAMTAPHIGNYGITPEDDQASRPHCAALVVRSMARAFTSSRAAGGLKEHLAATGVVALSEVDTRRLTRHVRSYGAMPAAIGTDVDAAELHAVAQATPEMTGRDLVSAITTPNPYVVSPMAERRAKVVAVDLGIKRSIIDQLTARGCETHVVPAGTSADAILAMRPDGVFLSSGPGDPEPLVGPQNAVRRLLGRVPIFGICLGHQVLGRALGASTFKLPFGHHGVNHPVRRIADGGIQITSQNHGFAVDLWARADGDGTGSSPTASPALPSSVATSFGDVIATHQNLNDGTLEGLRCRDVAAFSVQYHPEAAPGPADAVGLFDEFLSLMAAA